MKKSVKLGVFGVLMCLIAGMLIALSATPTKSLQTRAVNAPSAPPTVIFNRTLKSTSQSWGDCCQTATPGFFNIDPVLNFTCPGTTTCTVSAEMHVQAGENSTSTNLWALCALVDGNYMSEPAACPYVGELPTDLTYAAAGWTANMSKVAPGKHTLQSQIYTVDGATLAQYNITYRLYKP